MAKPQLENGYFKLANELRQAFAKTRISGEAMQVLWVIFGKTYGFNKKSDHIALSQFVDETGLSKTHVCNAVKKLLAMKLIITEKGNGTTKYAINKDFDSWSPLPKKVTLPKKVIVVTEKGNDRYRKRKLALPFLGHTKDNTSKDNKDTLSKDTMAHPFLTLFGELFLERFKTKYMANFQKDTVIAKKLYREIGEEETNKRLRRFFDDDDEFLRKAGHTVGVFRSRINSYTDESFENHKSNVGGAKTTKEDLAIYDQYKH